MKLTVAALLFGLAASSAMGQTNGLQNAGFETTCLFCGGPFPEGWHSPGNNLLARQRLVGDGGTPALAPVGTPNALTPHSGVGALQLATNGAGGFIGITTDTTNFCYCDQTCQTACSGPYPYFDPIFNWAGGDIVVTAWYMIPAATPLTDNSFIKINVKLGNQDVATADFGSGIPGVTGHTNDLWLPYTATFTRADIQSHYDCNTGATPDCGCVCVPLTPDPNHVKLTISRFVGDGSPSSGTIFWDDITYTQLPPVSPCGTSDFDGDGDSGTDADIEAFFACLSGNCCATCFPGGSDFDGDGDSGTDCDITNFFRVLGGNACGPC